MDIHDGEIMPTLENRRTFTRLIREWNADIVITNRPERLPSRPSLHLDPRAGFGVHGRPSRSSPRASPPLKRNPVFLYASDRFQRPNPFRADVAVGIDEVIEPMLDGLLLMESQIHEGGADGHAGLYPSDPAGRQKRAAKTSGAISRAVTPRRQTAFATRS